MTLVDNRQKASILSLVSNGFSRSEMLHLHKESGLTQANFISEHTLKALRKLLDCYDPNGVFIRQFTDPSGSYNLYSPEAIIACRLSDDSVFIRVNDVILRMPDYKPGMKNLVENSLALHEKLTTTPLLFANGTPFKMFDDGRYDFVEHLRELAREFGVETEYINDMNSANYSRRKLTMQHFFATFLCLSVEFGLSPRKFYYSNFMTGCDYNYKRQTVKFSPLTNLKETESSLRSMTMPEWYKAARDAKRKSDMAEKERRQADWKKKQTQERQPERLQKDGKQMMKKEMKDKGQRTQPPSYTNTLSQPVAPPPSYTNTRTSFTVVEENGKTFRRINGHSPKQGAQQKSKAN